MAKEQEFAPGIYDPKRFETIPTFKGRQRWKTVTHRHKAFKAGPHYDLRLLEPDSDNLHSWALRKWPKPGEKTLAVQQPTHSAEYIKFKGVIPKGYGAGSVDIHHKGTVTVTKSSPEKITFKRGKELFTLVKTKGRKEKDWLLLNRTKEAQAGGGPGGGMGGPSFSGVGPGPNTIVALLFSDLLKGKAIPKPKKGS